MFFKFLFQIIQAVLMHVAYILAKVFFFLLILILAHIIGQ